jgi:hypothetical protein
VFRDEAINPYTILFSSYIQDTIPGDEKPPATKSTTFWLAGRHRKIFGVDGSYIKFCKAIIEPGSELSPSIVSVTPLGFHFKAVSLGAGIQLS